LNRVPSCALRAHHILYTMPANRSGSVFTITTGSLLLIGSILGQYPRPLREILGPSRLCRLGRSRTCQSRCLAVAVA
jgi:hypothetical protein